MSLFILPMLSRAIVGLQQPPEEHSHDDGILHEADRPQVTLPAADTALYQITEPVSIDSLAEYQPDSLAGDTTRRRKKQFLDDILSGKNKDSLYFDVRNNIAYVYNEGDVTYQNINLKADFMRVNMDQKVVLAYGKNDTLEGVPTVTHPIFTEAAGTPKMMDTITYNLETAKAKIKGVSTQEGDGWLIGGEVKMVNRNTMYVRDGMYTTCEHTDHPHFYLKMNRSKIIPGKKAISGTAFMVLEDVPIYILPLPEGFFPLGAEARSGLLMPTFGEETRRGFFLRDLGYYFILGQHMDLALYGTIYTLGSWEARATSSYTKRYKYNGNLFMGYSSTRAGEKGLPDFIEQTDFRVDWTHTQDPKANPGSTFSASVNFRTGGTNNYDYTSFQDALQAETGSTIAYQRRWAGTPFSFATNLAISQNLTTKDLDVTFPKMSFNVSNFYPLKRKEATGKQRWYEKISMSYAAQLESRAKAKQNKFFSRETFDAMQMFGVSHTIPVKATYNVLNYINLTPAFNYSENWYFRRTDQVWNPETTQIEKLKPEYGFYRQYKYDTQVSASTTIYGMYENTKPDAKLQAFRHMLTPTVSLSYSPNFADLKYGFMKTVQTDPQGTMGTYSPYDGNSFAARPSGERFQINFGLRQNLEMKVLSKRDTSGVKKVVLIQDFSINGNYNFVQDSMKLSNITLNLSTGPIVKNMGLTISAELDPYRVTPEGKRYDKLFFPGRLQRASTSLGYTFSPRENVYIPPVNDFADDPLYANPFHDPYGRMDVAQRRMLMAQAYYNFNVPWSLNVDYSINYSIETGPYGKKGYRPKITQNLGLNGNITILPKLVINIISGYDFEAKKISMTSISIMRDMHCWHMAFSWIPFGRIQSWQFNIGVNAQSLQDLKYDKSQSIFDSF